MKKIFGFILVLAMGLSLTSCAVTAEAQTEDVYVSSNGVDLDVIITYGTPYYNADGLLLYYIYRNYYYYPFYSSDRWYFRSYSGPIRHYRPVPRDFYNHRPPVHHRRYNDVRPPRSNHHNGNMHRNGGGFNRPNGSGNIRRPNHGMRSSTRIHSNPRPQMNHSGGRGHFGGRR